MATVTQKTLTKESLEKKRDKFKDEIDEMNGEFYGEQGTSLAAKIKDYITLLYALIANIDELLKDDAALIDEIPNDAVFLKTLVFSNDSRNEEIFEALKQNEILIRALREEIRLLKLKKPSDTDKIQQNKVERFLSDHKNKPFDYPRPSIHRGRISHSKTAGGENDDDEDEEEKLLDTIQELLISQSNTKLLSSKDVLLLSMYRDLDTKHIYSKFDPNFEKGIVYNPTLQTILTDLASLWFALKVLDNKDEKFVSILDHLLSINDSIFANESRFPEKFANISDSLSTVMNAMFAEIITNKKYGSYTNNKKKVTTQFIRQYKFLLETRRINANIAEFSIVDRIQNAIQEEEDKTRGKKPSTPVAPQAKQSSTSVVPSTPKAKQSSTPVTPSTPKAKQSSTPVVPPIAPVSIFSNPTVGSQGVVQQGGSPLPRDKNTGSSSNLPSKSKALVSKVRPMISIYKSQEGKFAQMQNPFVEGMQEIQSEVKINILGNDPSIDRLNAVKLLMRSVLLIPDNEINDDSIAKAVPIINELIVGDSTMEIFSTDEENGFLNKSELEQLKLLYGPDAFYYRLKAFLSIDRAYVNMNMYTFLNFISPFFAKGFSYQDWAKNHDDGTLCPLSIEHSKTLQFMTWYRYESDNKVDSTLTEWSELVITLSFLRIDYSKLDLGDVEKPTRFDYSYLLIASLLFNFYSVEKLGSTQKFTKIDLNLSLFHWLDNIGTEIITKDSVFIPDTSNKNGDKLSGNQNATNTWYQTLYGTSLMYYFHQFYAYPLLQRLFFFVADQKNIVNPEFRVLNAQLYRENILTFVYYLSTRMMNTQISTDTTNFGFNLFDPKFNLAAPTTEEGDESDESDNFPDETFLFERSIIETMAILNLRAYAPSKGYSVEHFLGLNPFSVFPVSYNDKTKTSFEGMELYGKAVELYNKKGLNQGLDTYLDHAKNWYDGPFSRSGLNSEMNAILTEIEVAQKENIFNSDIFYNVHSFLNSVNIVLNFYFGTKEKPFSVIENAILGEFLNNIFEENLVDKKDPKFWFKWFIKKRPAKFEDSDYGSILKKISTATIGKATVTFETINLGHLGNKNKKGKAIKTIVFRDIPSFVFPVITADINVKPNVSRLFVSRGAPPRYNNHYYSTGSSSSSNKKQPTCAPTSKPTTIAKSVGSSGGVNETKKTHGALDYLRQIESSTNATTFNKNIQELKDYVERVNPDYFKTEMGSLSELNSHIATIEKSNSYKALLAMGKPYYQLWLQIKCIMFVKMR